MGIKALPLFQHCGLQRRQAPLLCGAPVLELAKPLLRAVGRLPGIGCLQAGGMRRQTEV